jgi:RNA polymerase sigma-70 factor, ECF subfamily
VTVDDLVARIVARDRDAETELIARYRAVVYVIIRKLTRDHSRAEDLVHDTLVLVIAKARNGEIREPSRVSGYVCSVARNVAIAHLRKLAREELGVGVSSADHSPDPLDRLLRKELEASVHQALSRLSSNRDREALYRFYVEEEDKGSICRDLGVSSLHFNRVLHRARKRLRELLQGGRAERGQTHSGV